MYKPLSIVLGILIIYLVSFVLIFTFSTLYFMLTKRVKTTFSKNVFHSMILAFINLVVTLLAIAVFSFNQYFFTMVSFFVFSGSYYLFYRYVWKLEKLDSIILAIGMAFILNPGWLIFLGII